MASGKLLGLSRLEEAVRGNTVLSWDCSNYIVTDGEVGEFAGSGNKEIVGTTSVDTDFKKSRFSLLFQKNNEDTNQKLEREMLYGQKVGSLPETQHCMM